MINDNICNILENDSSINKYIKDKLIKIYPDINLNNIDNELLENIILNIIDEDASNINKIKNDMVNNINNITNNTNTNTNTNTNISNDNFNKEIIKQNILMADEIIPEMSIPTNLIYINSKLNGKNVKVMIDTGASVCVIFKSVIDKCKLEYLIDKNTSIMIQGAHGMKPTLGTIWFVELELEIDNNNFVSVPISVNVIDDSETIKAKKIIKEKYDEIKNIVNTNDYMENYIEKHIENQEDIHDNLQGFEIILGMTFLKFYRANIDFLTMTLTLNGNIKIKFK